MAAWQMLVLVIVIRADTLGAVAELTVRKIRRAWRERA